MTIGEEVKILFPVIPRLEDEQSILRKQFDSLNDTVREHNHD